MKKGSLSNLLLSVVLLLAAGAVSPARAGTGQPPVLQVLDGSMGQLNNDSFNIVSDTLFFDTTFNSVLSKPYLVRNTVTLLINPYSSYALQGNFTATLNLEITKTAADGSTTMLDTSLTVRYTKDSLVTDQDSYLFSNAYTVKVKVISRTTDATWNVWQVLELDNELQSFPVYLFDCTKDTILSVTAASLDSNTTLDELPVSWANTIGADEYDLEWTYIDSSALANPTQIYGTPSNPNPALIFDNNSSRVTITGTSYNIPILYDGAGTLFFRVRPVQLQAGGGRSEGHWSSDDRPAGSFYFKGHQRNLNWQSTASYAEEGKRKVVVQYYDGSLRGRQTVTKDNTTNTTIVAESFYDYQGRPVIQVLPAPTFNSVIGYSKNFNIGLNGSAYDKFNFDSVADPTMFCNSGAAAMKTDSGAAQYYSGSNPLKDSGMTRFIPNAQGYPFTELEYVQDNTGRINRQSGVGINHRLGSGHETQYFYGTPDQHELDALFGTEVGDHLHYFKTMVQDANGQLSVSYTDMHGRTIATALAGAPPDSIKLDTLASYAAQRIVETISDASTNVTTDLVMQSKKTLLVSMPGLDTFAYKLNPANLQLPDCHSATVCYHCLYDLEITMTDDCDNQKLGGRAFDTVFHNFSLTSQIDTSCSAAAGFSISFTKYLPVGSYEITKKLSVSRFAEDYYLDSVYLKRNSCQSQNSFLLTQDSIQASITQCAPSCSTCQDSLGDFQTYYSRFIAHAGIASGDSSYKGMIMEAYQEAQADCRALCDSANQSDDILASMLLDLTPPSGQYANPDSSSDPYSIFYVHEDGSGNADSVPPYRKVTNYLNAFGQPDSVYDEAMGTMVPPQLLSPQAFSDKFNTSWATALLPYHPEYCKLLQYQMLPLSPAWDKRFEETDTYAGAMAKGYLNPTDDTTTSPYSRYNVTGGGAADSDPLAITYNNSGTNHYKANLEAQLTNYTASGKNSSDSVITMWEMATALIRCAGQDSTCIQRYHHADSAFNSNMCTGDLDMAWRSFRQMYLDVKTHLINVQLESPCPSPTVSALIAAGHQPHFTDASELIAATGTGLSDTAASAQAQAQSTIAGYYSSTCQAYVTMWWQDLRPCNYGSADSTILIPRLVGVCEAGSDANHPYGSSSVSPSSSYPYKSFEDVITQYNDSLNGVSKPVPMSCNAYTITAPAPYDQQVIYNSKPLWTRPDSCECSQIGSLYSNYQLVSGSYSSFSDYLNKAYQTQVTDSVLSLLLSLCNSSPTSSTCNYFAAPISLPPALQCSAGNSCVGCTQFKQLDAEFRGKYPGIIPVANPAATDSTQLASNQLYTNFMNYRLGFSKTISDYLVFLNSCSGASDSAANGVGAAGPTTYDTATVSCNGLDSLLHQYKLGYLQPVTGYTDLDMRTFAGNITPADGPKGVFNIHGQLIGNTIDSSTDQVNISFAQKWNSDTADQRVGTLSALSNGRFHLLLNPGQITPKGGIVGMRYYQFDDPYDTLDAVLTNLGSYIDFGDGQGIMVDSTLSNSTNYIFSILYGNIPNFAPTYPVAHVYSSTAIRTVTVYHTDIYGVLGFDNWLTPNPGRYLALLKNLRGYAPQDCRVLIIHGSHDSTFNTFNGLDNGDELTGIQFLQFQNGLQNYNFGSFQSLHNLKYLWFDHSTTNPPNLDSVFPNMPVNFPNLSYLEFSSNFNLDSMDFALPYLRVAKFNGQDSSRWVDRILNQIGPAVTLDSGIVSFDTASAGRTSASNSAVSRLESMKWAIVTRDSTINMAVWDSAQLHIKSDSTFNPKKVYPIGSAFTDFINGKFGTFLTKNGVDSLYLEKCGAFPNTDTPDTLASSSRPDTCSSLTFVNTYGGSGTELAHDLVQTPDGSYLMAGQTNSAGNGGWDGFVMKTNKAGVIQWSKTYGGTGDDILTKVRSTSDGGFIAVGTTKSFKDTLEPFVVKADANGTVQWVRTLDAGTLEGEAPADVIQTKDGGYAIAATTVVFGSLLEIIRLDSTGATLWADKINKDSSSIPAGIAGGLVEDRDSLVFSGNCISENVGFFNTGVDGIIMKINSHDGSIVWSRTLAIDSSTNFFADINNTSNGYLINSSELDVSGGGTLFDFNSSFQQVVFRVDKNGFPTVVEKMTAPTSSNDSLAAAYPTSDGGFISAQTGHETNADVYLQKANSGGSVTWSNRIQLSGNQQIYHIIQNIDGGYSGIGTSGSHVLLVRANPLGQTGCHDTAVSFVDSTPAITRYADTITAVSLTITNTSRSVTAGAGFSNITTWCSNPCTEGISDTLFLCGRSAPVFPPVNVNSISNCSDSNFFAVSKSTVQFTDYTDSLTGNFDSSYRALCLQAYLMESFTVTQTQSEYHHTLYYYDQAGNLLKTVPPAGVNANYGSTWLASVAVARAAGTSVVPSHGLLTQYRYNTLNQVMAQQTPDAGQSHFWYDRLGRLAISQNARQRTASGSETGSQYSYTLYDSIGRITEVGQITNAGSTPMSDSISRTESLLTSWIAASASNKEQITTTVYDLPYTGFTGLSFTPVVQRNLRNRVAYSTFAIGSNPAQYNQGTFYTYDIEGNVDTLLQDFGSSSFTGLQNIMNTNGNRFKRMVYNYDLVSGKVNSVAFQPHQADAFYHRYTYDAENRLILTETSSDSVYWDKEARYQYYKHGPLARTIIGDKMVQGLDYAYTLQGWLKGANSASLTPGYDMGRDGDTTWQNRYVGKDAFGFGLNYFAGDYSAIGDSANPFPGTSAYLNTSYRPLYNGNISSMAVNIAELYTFDSSHWRGPMLYNYRYDQLNRITGMDAFYGLNQSTNSWATLTATPDFKERVAYDPNGNIQKYLRNNFGETGLPMDSLGYGYMTGTNKLVQIKDSASDAIGGGYDLHSQPTNNYAYDSIGNLIKDSIEHISLIKWNVYGKITEIDHSTTTIAKPTKNIYYYYDAAGNRIGKKTTSGDSSTVSYTWYVRDASGNVMATYTAGIDSSAALSAADLHVGEKDIYGSSRLGLLNANYSVDAAGDGFSAYTSPWTGAIIPYYTGRKQYELANHLGNVLATITDKKIGVSLSADSSLIDHYEADVQTAQDYYPFGMIMPGRMFTSLSIPGGSIDSGTTQVNGYTLPVDLVLTSRPSDTPTEYAATKMIDLDQGFGSNDSSDVFTAYIADTTYAGTGNGGSNADGVAGQGKYRYGFNGQEKDEEIKGQGNSYTAEFWEYDPRVGRRWNLDPKPTVGISEYSAFNNSPIFFSDPLGDTTHLIIYGSGYENTSTNQGNAGDGFKRNAEILKKRIEASQGFDKKKDAVVLVYAPNAKRFLDATNKVYASGKIASLTVFSHGFASSQSNPDQIGGLSLGGEREGDIRSDGTKVTKEEADVQLRTYNLREINGTNMGRVDNKNFDPKVICTFYGCNLGGVTSGEMGPNYQWSMAWIKKFSFAQNFANKNNLTVHAFSGSAVFKKKNGENYYDGSMIMYIDRKTNDVRLSTYTPYTTPIVSPPPKK